MSELASLLADLKAPRKGPACQFGALLQELAKTDPQGRDALEHAVDNHGIAATIIANACMVAGHDISVHSIRRHRKRGTSDGCTCA